MIRLARPDEIALLPQIENAADERFRRGFAKVARGDLTPAMRQVLMTEVPFGHLVWQRAVMVRSR